jgi:hypothetical protein
MKFGVMKKVGILAALMLFGLGRPVRADIITGMPHTWDLGSHGWTNEFGDVTLERQTSGGNPNGWLRITFPATGNPENDEVGWYDIIHVSTDNLLLGSLSTNLGFAIDFWAQDRLPHDLQFKFGAGSGNIWGYGLTGQLQQTKKWTTLRTPFRYSDAWGGSVGYDNTVDQFVSDLASVDWVGLYIWREEASQEIYGIDNFRIMVPEPAEMLMLAFALVTSAMSLRRRGGQGEPEAGPATK